MNIEKTKLDGVYIIEPTVFADDRGFFFEAYNREKWLQAELPDIDFIQDNHSRSIKGVLRGLHYQLPPKAQAKLVRCTRGKIFDVAVDIRKASPTYLQWIGIELSEENKKQLFIPEGFLHGFYTIEDADVLYKTNHTFEKALDGSVRYDDPSFNIVWPCDGDPIVSQKDQSASAFVDMNNPF